MPKHCKLKPMLSRQKLKKYLKRLRLLKKKLIKLTRLLRLPLPLRKLLKLSKLPRERLRQKLLR